MDLSAIAALNGLSGASALRSVDPYSEFTEKLAEKNGSVDGNLFGAMLNTAIDNIKTTNSYLSDMEDEEVKFMLGETENTHDLTIALQKASTALSYTVAIRDRLLEAYRELMQMQI